MVRTWYRVLISAPHQTRCIRVQKQDVPKPTVSEGLCLREAVQNTGRKIAMSLFMSYPIFRWHYFMAAIIRERNASDFSNFYRRFSLKPRNAKKCQSWLVCLHFWGRNLKKTSWLFGSGNCTNCPLPDTHRCRWLHNRLWAGDEKTSACNESLASKITLAWK